MLNEECKRCWEERANSNPLFWIISNDNSKDEEKFFNTGKNSYDLVTKDIKIEDNFDVLEIGCGVGRIMFEFCKHCNIVYGVDISKKYIELAREYRIKFGAVNTVFYECNGSNFYMFDSNQFNFIYSFIVFQHFPYESMIIDNLRDAYRILKPNCFIKFHHYRLSSQREGNLSFTAGCSLEKGTILKLCDEVGFKFVSEYPDEAYEQFHDGWWTILRK